MNRKSFQLSLGSLFLATFTFGIGIVIGLRFNLSREEDRAREEAAKEETKAVRQQLNMQQVLSDVLTERMETQADELRELRKVRGK